MSPSPSQQPVIIIRKKGRHHHGHHGGAWKVAYADFVTAMMAFFLVMWIVGQSKATKQAVAGYFRDPVAFQQAQGGGSGVLPGAMTGAVGGGQSAGQTDVRSAQATLERAAEHLRDALARTPHYQALKDRIEIVITEEGLRIELREAPDDGFFASGSAVAKPAAVELLGVIAHELAAHPNKVAVEGHTDRRPYAGGTRKRYSNWELSADRANAARRIIEEEGIAPSRIDAVRGFADTRPRVADPYDASNRRISILVRRTDSSEHDTPTAAPAAPAPAAEPAGQQAAAG